MTDTRTPLPLGPPPGVRLVHHPPPDVRGFQYDGDLAYELRSHSIEAQRPWTCSTTCWPSASWKR